MEGRIETTLDVLSAFLCHNTSQTRSTGWVIEEQGQSAVSSTLLASEQHLVQAATTGARQFTFPAVWVGSDSSVPLPLVASLLSRAARMLSMQDTMAACSLWHCFAHWELLASPGLEAPTTCALAVSISMRALPPVALASPDGDEDMEIRCRKSEQPGSGR
jgi:hypothetical protein